VKGHESGKGQDLKVDWRMSVSIVRGICRGQASGEDRQVGDMHASKIIGYTQDK